jgi:hypothetical protein
MQLLAGIIRARHNGGNGNGRDQVSTSPSSAPPPPSYNSSRLGPRGADRRRNRARDGVAQDRALVDDLNWRSLIRRYPGVAQVRLTGSWRG